MATNTPANREWGTSSLVDIYAQDTPGQHQNDDDNYIEQLDLLVKETSSEDVVDEHIVKVKDGYRLMSKNTGKNLGTYPTRAGAEKREREVQYFKQHEAVATRIPLFKTFLQS